MNTESRDEFEAFISLPPHEKEILRFPDDGSSAWPGSYKNLIVDLAWDAWQASRQAVSVPEEPTDEMLEASMSDRDRQYSTNAKRYLRYVYQAMVKAAQQPPKQEGE